MSFKAFLRENVAVRKEKEVIISERFKDDAGKAVPWKIRTITAEENAELQQQATVRKKGETEFDGTLYIAKLTAACVVFPDLKSAELQKSYGVMGDDVLLKSMLTAGEYSKLSSVVQALNGMDEDISELIEQVKN